MTTRLDLAGATVETFAPYVTQRFEQDGGVELELVGATLSRYATDGRARPFSLIFAGPVNPALNQQIHKLSHRELGELEIFLVPIGADESGRSYEAVFN